MSQEKTEKATPKKKEESRRKGQVAKSMEIPGALVLLLGFLCLFFMAALLGPRLYELFIIALHEYMLWEVTLENTTVIFGGLIVQGLLLLTPIFLITVAIAIVGNYVQIGLLLSGEPLKMKLSKLNPIEGAKRIFALRAVVEFLKTIFKMLVIGSVVFGIIWSHRHQIVSLSFLQLEDVFAFIAKLTVMIGLTIGLLLLVLAIFDYMYQRYDYEKRLRMSKQDVKDEHKKAEGDPLIRSRLREKQRSMAMQRMMQEVPKADVIITNPTHFAVALQYDAATMEAPVAVAKGKGYVALKIREMAQEHEIILMENRPLARALFEQAEIGQEIPTELFQAVAEVLAYVYSLKKK